MNGIEGRIVYITGAASGIGLATAERFLSEKAHCVLIDLPSQEDTKFKDHPGEFIYLQADITKKDDLQKIEKEMAGGIDVLINNAGITRDSTLLKMTEEAFDQVISVNLKSVYCLSQMAARVMKEKKHGVILNAASVVAHYGNFGQTNYVASKAAVVGMTKTMARELGAYGIRVNAVAPGFIATSMVKKMPEKVIQMMEEKTPLKRVGLPEEIASSYLWLASDEASFITGTTINVDGGLVI